MRRSLMRLTPTLAVLAMTFASVSHLRADARPPEILDAAGIRQALRRLEVAGSALYVGAHPDDENTAFLAYLVGQRMVRTAYLSLTRGDGGQNLLGSESGELLGVIRTQELLAARRIDGAEQYFTRALDFGFSKSSDETFEQWGRDSILADVVWVIRSFRPDLIVTRFPPDSTAGHGHHAASAILAEEAFAAAADPNRFPDQLRSVRPWQAKRVVWNVFSRGGQPPPPGKITADLGSYNPLLGRSYSEIAGQSRSMHKSQGFGAPERRGTQVNVFEPRAGAAAERDLFDGVDLSWSRFPGGERITPLVRQAQAAFDDQQPQALLPMLVRIDTALRELPGDPLVASKRRELLEIIRSCAGLWVEAIAADPGATPGDSVRVSVTAINRSAADLTLEGIDLPFGATAKLAGADAEPSAGGRTLPANQPVTATAVVRLPADLPLTQPYWLRKPPARGRFQVDDPSLRGRAENPPALAARVRVRIAGDAITFDAPVVYRWTDPVLGERYRPFEVTPAVTLELDQSFYVFPDAHSRAVRVTARAGRGNVSGRVRLKLPAGWQSTPEAQPVAIRSAGAETTVTFTVQPGSGASRLAAEFESQRKITSFRLVRVDYPHLPVQTLFPPADVPLVRADIARRGQRVGYVMGSGDHVPEALRQMGWDVTLLSDDDLDDATLARFDAVVTGVRAFNTRPRLREAHPRLLEYVNRGGTLVVQYNTADTTIRLGPYPMRISRDRVAVEEAPVAFLDPTHPLLAGPNRITARDFEGWVQERGLYFANPWDPRYQTVLSCHDRGEPARDGGLLVARYGRGTFIYSGYAWWRQLPAGVPGAYRMFANLVSAGPAR